MSEFASKLGRVVTLVEDGAVAGVGGTKETEPFEVSDAEYYTLFIKPEGTNPVIKITQIPNMSETAVIDRDYDAGKDPDGNELVVVASTSVNGEFCIASFHPYISVRTLLKITGLAGNDSDTIVSIYMVKQVREY